MEEPSDDRDRSRSRSPQTQRGLDQESGTSSRFYLGNLGSRIISEKDLTEFFGKMVSAEITDVLVKHHKGFGYIEFGRTSQYEESKLLGKHVINGRNIECKRAKPREQIQNPPKVKQAEDKKSNDQSPASGPDKSGSKRFFIGGINSTFTQNDIVEYFRQFGIIVDVLLLFHKGFGYIEFSKMSDFYESKIIGTHNIRGRSLEVKKAKPKGPPSSGPHPMQHVQNTPLPPMPVHVPPPPPPVHQAVFNSQHHHGREHPGMHNVQQDSTSPRYFLGGVNEDITHQDLKDYFKQFGQLVDVTIIPNKNIGYIQYKKSSEAVEAEREDKLFHQKHHIKNRLINCSRANPKQNYSQDFNFQKPHPPFSRPNFQQPEQDNLDHIQEVSPRRFFLGGVNATTTRANLTDYFSKYGEIINLMIFEVKNYGYIEFMKTTPEDDTQRESILIGDAGRSLHTISGVTVTCKRAIPKNMKQQQVQPHIPPQPEPQEDKVDDSKFKMFVGGLGLLTEGQLKEYFCTFGAIDSVILLRGFGFITFKMAGVVDQVIEEGKVINGKTMHCISGKYVECKRTHGRVFKKPRPAGGMFPGQTPQFPGQMPPTQGWNNFNPEAPPFTPTSMQQNPGSQPLQFPQGGYYPQGQGGGGAFPGQMTPQGYAWNNYGMMPQQGFDMNNPGVMAQQGYDMNNAAMMGQQGYDMNNPAMMGQQGYDWNSAGMAPQQYVDWSAYMAQQNFDWNSGVATYNPYYAGQTIQFPDFVTGESSSSMNASEQGSTSADNDNSSASTPTQDSQQTASSNMEERTEEISDNTSSMSVQSVLSKYATTNSPQTKTVQSVLSKYSVVPTPTIQTDYSSGEQQDSGEDQGTAHSSGNGRRLYENRSVQHNVNGGEEEEEEEWFEGDLE